MNETETTATPHTIDARATALDLSAWLTKAEAAHALGSSEKHIERLAKKGAVQQLFRKAPGQARISIFHPGDIERVLAAQTPAFRTAYAGLSGNPEKALVPLDRIDNRSPDVWSSLASTLAGLSEFAQKLNAQHAKPSYVSIEDALRITGLSAATIRRLAREGRIMRLSRKYRRADLEGL